VKLSLQLGILSAANIGLTFLFQWYILTQIGPGIETDALFAAMTIPQLVLAVISGSLMHVLVPLLSGEREERLRHDAWGFLVLVTALFGFLAILLYVAAPWWVSMTVPGFSASGQAFTVMLTRIQLVGMVFTAINGVQWAAYHARQRFLWAEFTPILAGAISILLLYWALPRFGVIAAAWISTMRMGLQTLLLAPVMGRFIRPDLNSASIHEAWRRIKPLLFGTAYYKTDPMIDRYLLSSASSGSLSLYYLAQQIYGAISQVLNKAISAPLVPILSRLDKSGNKAGIWQAYNRKLLQVGAISIAGLLVTGFVGQEILSLTVGHGNITVNNVKELWWILIWLGGMFIGGVMGQICASTFYAVGDTMTPTRMTMFSYTLYIPFKVMSYWFWGVAGLAIATSIYYITNLMIQIYLLKRKLIC